MRLMLNTDNRYTAIISDLCMGMWGTCKVNHPYTESSSASNPMRERDDINTTLATVSDGLGKDIRSATFKGNFIDDLFQV